MRVALLIDPVAPDASPDRLDTLEEAAFVERMLHALGHQVRRFVFTPNDPTFLSELIGWEPERAFNLVESVSGRTDLLHLAPAVLETLGIPITGASAGAIALTTNKALAKSMMTAVGITTPAWIVADVSTPRLPSFPGPYMVKPACEDGSVGIDAACVVMDEEELGPAVGALADTVQGDILIEQFVVGREFNVGILDGPDGPQCLPVSEIVFEEWNPDEPKIVGYRAKWDEASPQWRKTVRRFLETKDERSLVGILDQIALKCWQLFRLSGFARVDFRVDADGRAWLLEVNANPCISPDAGFVAAAKKGGLKPQEVIGLLLDCSLRRSAPIGS